MCDFVELLTGYDISHIFSLKRPLVDFSWEQVMNHTNNVFELESMDNVQAKREVKLDEEDMPDGHPGPQSGIIKPECPNVELVIYLLTEN